MAIKQQKHWEHFSHDADIGIRGIGPTIDVAFQMAAVALTSVVTDLNNVIPRQQIAIQCAAPDLELLFVDWLNAIIYQMATRNMLFSEFAIQIQDLTLQAMIKGEKIDRQHHHPVVEIKGATYTELKVYQRETLWIAQCVVDV